MKKALIAVSVAAGLAGIAYAENTTTLYGAIGFQTQLKKEGDQSIKDNAWDLSRSPFKWGIKGTEDMDNGVQVFYKMEFGGVDETKKAYLGFRGGFGEIKFGKQDSLYKLMTNYNDNFEDVFFGHVHFGAATGGGTLPKTISYISPEYSGFHVALAGVLDGSHEVIPGDGYGYDHRQTYTHGTDSKSLVAYQLGVWYAQNGIHASLGYSNLERDRFNVNDKGLITTKISDGTLEAVGGNIGYSNDQFKVGLGAEHLSSNGEVYNIAGEYYYGPNTFRAGIGMYDPKEGDDRYVYALGYKYAFSKRTYTYVEGEYIDYNNDDIDNGYTVNIGIRHDF